MENYRTFITQEKKTKPPTWTKREILDGIFYQLKNGCNWGEEPKDFPPYSTVYWHYKQWRGEGIIEEIMKTLHGQLREKINRPLAKVFCDIIECYFLSNFTWQDTQNS